MTMFKQFKNNTLKPPPKSKSPRPKTVIHSNMGLEKILKANDRALKIINNR
ncbi:hypothetical protein [Paenibacillus sp. 1A_MP2]|uniref:hypothetical protein n=1 Tax=Paenibacillus sp. 1A_MP2 TaxID=3457495 RepID=UPI003FCD1B6C